MISYKCFISKRGGKGTYPEMRTQALVYQARGWTVRIKKNDKWGFYLQVTHSSRKPA